MRFEITPMDGLVDSDITIRLVGAEPRTRIDITASAEDADDHRWSATGQWLAGEDGTIDITKEPPIRGAYPATDPVGLITHMTPEGKAPSSIFATADASDLRLDFKGECQEETCDTTVVRRFKAATVRPETVDDDGVRGLIYLPAGRDPLPAVLIVPGIFDARVTAHPIGALLASHGYASLVVDYFDAPGLPANIEQIPLETFRSAAQWLNGHERVESGRVCAYGLEKGAEAVLATAAYLDDFDVKAIVATSPTCVTWPAEGPSKPKHTSSWTVDGQPLPYMPVKKAKGQKIMRSITKREGGAVSELAPHTAAFEDTEAFKRATIPVEHIDQPILLLAGADDQRWPAAQMAELFYKARRASGGNEKDQKVTFNGAGSILRFPHLPSTVFRYLDPEHGAGFVLGGDHDGSTHADASSWAKTLDFMADCIGAPGGEQVAGETDDGEVVDDEAPALESRTPTASPDGDGTGNGDGDGDGDGDEGQSEGLSP